MRTKMEPSESKAQRGFQGALRGLCLLAGTAVLGACSSGVSAGSSTKLTLAPPPGPATTIRAYDYTQPGSVLAAQPLATPAAFSAALALKQKRVAGDCSVKDRFDRKYVVAYQWGRAGESRIALDVDGIGFDGGELEGVKLEYKLRLQPIAGRKDHCRVASNWQGILGTGYHELFMREDDSVWDRLEKLGDDVDGRLETLIGH